MTTLGQLLRNTRRAREMTLRDVEAAARGKVSNAYLSQIENGRVINPSPPVLAVLSDALVIQYSELMAAAGYRVTEEIGKIPPKGRSIHFLTDEEHDELCHYLAFIRWKKR